MCGFVGIHRPDDESLSDPGLLGRMTDTLRHRGPDEGRLHRQPRLGLGFRRLSIIDLEGGSQPIHNEDGSVVMVCNGEIYNYRPLRERLLGLGHEFRAKVDVEVVVHLYEEYGPSFLELLNGQFAIALYDCRRRFLLLARDPAGIAPLFYAWRDGTLLFASEIKALLEHPLVERRVDLTGLDQVLTFPGPVSPRTLFAGVSSLPPGHYLSVKDGIIETGPYWDLNYPTQAELDDSAAPDFGELEARLLKAVKVRLQADVPVGFYLSGGLDSSLIAALIREADGDSPRPRHSFSIGFNDGAKDERRYQQMMADRLRTIHHLDVFDSDDIEAGLQQAVLHAEMPLKESYDTCSLALSRMVRAQGLKVVLTGEGADELFGGYIGYRLDGRINGDEEDDWSLEGHLEREARATLWGDDSFFYEKNYASFREIKSAIYSPALAADLKSFDCTCRPIVDTEKLCGRHPIHQRSYVDFKLRLADHLLADHGDRVSYAHSVEARYPFLDPSVIEWVRAAHPQWLVRGHVEKYPLRQVATRHLPPEIVEREKFGFVAPSCAALLRRRAEWVEDFLSYESVKRGGYFNPDVVERLKVQYRQDNFEVNTTFDTDFLMIVLTFEMLRHSFSLPCA